MATKKKKAAAKAPKPRRTYIVVRLKVQHDCSAADAARAVRGALGLTAFEEFLTDSSDVKLEVWRASVVRVAPILSRREARKALERRWKRQAAARERLRKAERERRAAARNAKAREAAYQKVAQGE